MTKPKQEVCVWFAYRSNEILIADRNLWKLHKVSCCGTKFACTIGSIEKVSNNALPTTFCRVDLG